MYWMSIESEGLAQPQLRYLDVIGLVGILSIDGRDVKGLASNDANHRMPKAAEHSGAAFGSPSEFALLGILKNLSI